MPQCRHAVADPPGWRLDDGRVGGRTDRALSLDPAGGPEEVELYPPRIEQGFGAPARHVTGDVGLVLRAARHYAERGEFDPSVPWEE